MPYDSNGNFSLVPGTIVADGMNVQPSQHNPPFQDVANGLSQVVVRDGRAPMTGPLNMNGYKITGVAAGDAPTDVVTNADIADLGVAIGDFKDSLRDLSPNWLRRDGKLYLRADYPDLAELLPALPDSILWTAANTGTATGLLGLTQGAGKYVASGGAGGIFVSTDRLNWTPRDASTTATLGRAMFGSGIFVITGAGGIIVKSQDGDDWASQTILSGGLTNGGAHDGTNFIIAASLSGNPRVLFSADAADWTTVTPPGTGGYGSVGANSTISVLVGSGGKIATSTDHGATWTARSSGVSVTLNACSWFEDLSLFVVAGNSGVILTSPDGAAWTQRTSGTSVDLNAVGASDSGVAIGGDTGTILISSNGTSYTSIVTGFTMNVNALIADQVVEAHYVIAGTGGRIYDGIRTSPTQFRVPDDNPAYGWIRAL